MLKDQTPESGIIFSCIMLVMLSGFAFLLAVIPVFIALWLFGDWSLATKYAVPGSFTVAVIGGAIATTIPLTVRKTEFSVLGFAAAGLFVYFAFITSFEFSSTGESEEPAQELTESQKYQIRLNDECRVIGMQYARVASASFNGASSGRDVVIPSKCRGRAATQEGMRLAR